MLSAAGVALVLIAFLCVLRIPSAIRHRAARPAWIASIAATVGLMTLGMGVPIERVDAFLGSSNLWNLAEALAATTSFWFFRRALQLLDDDASERSSPIPLIVLLTSISVAFATIHRGSTDVEFVDHNLRQPGLFVYLVIYLSGLAWIATTSAWIVRRRIRSIFALFVAGYVLVLCAAGVDLVYVSAGFLDVWNHSTVFMFFEAFVALFYPGVLLLAVGFSACYSLRWAREVRPLWRIYLVIASAIHLRMNARPIRSALRGFTSPDDAVLKTLDSVVGIRDLEFTEHLPLSSVESTLIGIIEDALARRAGLGAPIGDGGTR